MTEMIIGLLGRDVLTFWSLSFITAVFILSVGFLLLTLWLRARQIRPLVKKCAKLQQGDRAAIETSRVVMLKVLVAPRWLEPAARESEMLENEEVR